MDKHRFENGTVLVGFELPATVPATTVSVCGDFNEWQPGAHPLRPSGDGRFRTEIVFPAGGRRRFRYLVDGERWENDPAADGVEPNGLGGDDSVVDLVDTGALPDVAVVDDGAEAGPGLQRVRLRRQTWQRIEDEAAARGVEPQHVMAELVEAAMSPDPSV